MTYWTLISKSAFTNIVTREPSKCVVSVVLAVCLKDALEDPEEERDSLLILADTRGTSAALHIDHSTIKYVEADSVEDALKKAYPQLSHLQRTSEDERAINLYAELRGFVSTAGIEI